MPTVEEKVTVTKESIDRAQAPGTLADRLINGSITVAEVGLFALLSDIWPGSKDWILKGCSIGQVNPYFNAMGALFVLNAANSVYKAVNAQNRNRDHVIDVALNVSSTALIGVAIFGTDFNPALGAVAPYIFAGVIAFNAAVAAANAVYNLDKVTKLRANFIENIKPVVIKNRSESTIFIDVTEEDILYYLNSKHEEPSFSSIDDYLMQTNVDYKRYKTKANSYAWQAARGCMTAAAVATILVFGAVTGPLAGAIVGAVSTLFIATFLVSAVKSKPTQSVSLPVSADKNNSADAHNITQADLGVASYDQKTDHIKALKFMTESADRISYLNAELAKAEADYNTKINAGNSNGALHNKVGLINDLKELLNKSNPSIEDLNKAVAKYRGGLFTRGALSSFWKRFGGMQSLVEAVEYTIQANAAQQYQDGFADRGNVLKYAEPC